MINELKNMAREKCNGFPVFYQYACSGLDFLVVLLFSTHTQLTFLNV